MQTTANQPILEQLGARAAARTVPLSALVELTHSCNLRCRHCYLAGQPSPCELTGAEWRRVFGELAEAGCLFLTLTGGELLCRRDWLELATYARTLGFAVRLCTNGSLITEETAAQIAALRGLGVSISLHGADAVTHDAVVGSRGAFERTVGGIRALRGRGVEVRLKTVLMARNLGAHRALRELAQQLDCEIAFDLEVTPRNDGDATPTRLRARGAAAVAAARAVIDGGPRPLRPTCRADRAAMLEHGPCHAGRSMCHIGPGGDVHPCVQWVRPVGNLRRQSFRDIWTTSADLARLRRLRFADCHGCVDCELFEICSPCVALSLLENGNLDGPSPTRCRSARLRAHALRVAGAPPQPRVAAAAPVDVAACEVLE